MNDIHEAAQEYMALAVEAGLDFQNAHTNLGKIAHGKDL
jgi:hypothetical protein